MPPSQPPAPPSSPRLAPAAAPDHARRPRQSHRSDIATAFTTDEIEHRLHWALALDTGLIANRNPPAPADVVAIRAHNDALFRAIGRTTRKYWAGFR